MKKLVLIPALLLAAVFSGCEKDDICSEGTSTTPRLIMQFYNIDNPSETKNVTSLLVKSSETDTLAIFNGVSKIELPLKTLEDVTAYRFTLNSNNTAFDNEDILTFNYTRDDVFVSRACGFKTVFLLDDTTPFIQDNGADLQWMQNVTVEQFHIQNENEVHISVLF